MSKCNENWPGYKDTKAGWIPEGWDCLKIGDLFSFKNGLNKEKSFFGEGSPIINYSDVLKNKGLNAKDILGKVTVTNSEKKNHEALKGDVFFTRTSETVKDIGLSSVVIDEIKETVFSGFLLRARPKDQTLHNHFKKYCFSTYCARKQIIRTGSYTTRALTNGTLLSAVYLAVPPSEEQRKIAEVLSTWDTAIELVGKQSEAKQQLKRGLMQQLLPGKKRFQGFDDEWREFQLGQFLNMKLRKVEKPKDAYLRLGVRSHGKGTFTTIIEDPNKIGMTHLYQVREGDLIVSITFAWEGAIAMVKSDGDLAHVSHRFPTYKFETNMVVSEFFRYLMLTPRFFYDLGVVSPGGAGRNRVMSKRNFLKMKVKVPSVEEQKRIGETLMTLDKELSLLEMKLKKLENQKRGLMQKLLTGEVRVQKRQGGL